MAHGIRFTVRMPENTSSASAWLLSVITFYDEHAQYRTIFKEIYSQRSQSSQLK